MDAIMNEIKEIVKDAYKRGYSEGYSDGIADYKRYSRKEEKEGIRVGDVLKAIAEIDEDDALEYIVTYIDHDHKHYDCICPDGAVYQDVDIQNMAKTGKRYKITFTEEK